MFDFNSLKPHFKQKDILGRVSSYDIFKYYISNFKRLGESFCSELRSDKKPSCSLYQNDLGIYRYKDFSTGDNLSCFQYVMLKYNCTYQECLNIIANDFNLFKSNIKGVIIANDIIPEEVTKVALNKNKTVIIPYHRAWNTVDRNYWVQFGLNIEILNNYDVKPCEFVLIGSGRITETNSNPIYSYEVDGLHKIYRPLDTMQKWWGNTTRTSVQGYKQLSTQADLLIITKSLKDVMCFRLFGYEAVSFNSETTIPTDEIMDNLKTRFKTIKICLDSDETGVKYSKKLSEKFNLEHTFIPRHKDLSDFIKNEGIDEAKILIDSLL